MTPIPEIPNLPPSTIVPIDDDQFFPYLTTLYEDIAFTTNFKDNDYFNIPISDIATNIPIIPQFGAFIICVSASKAVADGSYPPSITASLCKSSPLIAGSIAVLGSQAGQGGGVWGGATLTITSTATNFQINHSVASTTGSFNMRFIRTNQ